MPAPRLLGLLVVAAVAVGTIGCAGSDDTADTGTTADDTVDGTAGGTAADEGADTTSGAADGGAAAAPIPSPGCGTAPAGEEVTLEPRTLQVAGAERTFLLTTPATAPDEPLPLVLDFHGLAEGAEIHSQMSQFSPLAQEEGFVVAFPQGTGSPVRWDAAPTTDPAGDPNADLELVDTIIETLGAERCIDTSRVYSTGLSYGAIMTSLLMCTRADTFAAVAPVAGLQVPEPCEPSRPIPVLTFHGTADPILTFDGKVGESLGTILSGGEQPASTTSTTAPDLDGEGYPAHVAAWAEMNGCDPDPTDTEVSETVIHRTYDCPEGADVEFFVIVGGGHSWPGSEFSKSIESIVGPTTFDIDATREAWAFFQRFSLPARPSSEPTGEPTGEPAAALDDLVVAPEGSDADYDRDLFGDWSTQPDGCTTRERVLIDEAVEAPAVGDDCAVGDGEWRSVYDGLTVEDPGDLDIDHLVPLAEAWSSGASEWTDERREEFANNLADPAALVAVTAGSNRSKGDRDPAEWQPPERSAWCPYATAWIGVKVAWGLSADPAEVAGLETMLATCPG